MKYLKLYENYNWEKYPYTRNGREYTFTTNEWDYKVSVLKNNSNGDYPWVGFKAKKNGEMDFNYDMSVITNDDIHGVMDTIRDIINTDYEQNNNSGYSFSFIGDARKSSQRLNLYRRYLKGWDLTEDEGVFNNAYILTKEAIKTFEFFENDLVQANGERGKVLSTDGDKVYVKMFKSRETLRFNERDVTKVKKCMARCNKKVTKDDQGNRSIYCSGCDRTIKRL